MTQNSKYEVRKFGPTTLRRDYSISQKKFDTPDFLEMQRVSVEKFIKEDIENELRNIYPIEAAGKVRIDYLHNTAKFEVPKKSEFDCIREAKKKRFNLCWKIKSKIKTN